MFFHLAGLVFCFSAAAQAHSFTAGAPDGAYQWISMDPHVHTKVSGSDGCPDQLVISKAEMMEFGLRYGLQLVVDNYWGAHLPNAEERNRFPLPFTEARTPLETVHGNNHLLNLSFDPSGRPTSTNLLDGLEISWFISDRGSHLGILGAKTLNWFFAKDGTDKPKTAVDALEALAAETSAHNRAARTRNDHFVIVSHMFQWNPHGFPQTEKWDFGRQFELPVTVAFPAWNVRGLGTERTYGSENAGEDMEGAPIDTSTFDALVKLENSGFKMSVIGESDYSCLAQDDRNGPRGNGLGRPEVLRTLVGARRDHGVTYQAVLDAALAGRVVVTNQPKTHPELGHFTVQFGREKAALGETLRIKSSGKPVEVEIKNVPKEAVILVNGGDAIRNFRGALIRDLQAGGKRTGPGKITLTQSSWIVAKTPHEFANPIYVELDDQPVRVSAEDPCYFIGHIERTKQELLKPRGDKLNLSDYPDSRKAHLLERYDEAEQVYVQRFTEARARHGGPELASCLPPVK